MCTTPMHEIEMLTSTARATTLTIVDFKDLPGSENASVQFKVCAEINRGKIPKILSISLYTTIKHAGSTTRFHHTWLFHYTLLISQNQPIPLLIKFLSIDTLISAHAGYHKYIKL